MSKLTNMWEVFKSYREQNGFPTTEEKPKKLTVRDDPEYFKRYYEEHAEERKEYARKYYQENKAKLYNNRLTKNQQLVYNYCLKEHWPTGEVLPIYHIAHELGIHPYHIWRSIKALINKGKLFQDGNTTYIEKPKEVLAPTLFDENEPDLYEDVHTSTKLEDEVYELKRRLENAEDRYLKLLGEYEEYKKEVGNAFEEFIKANYAEDNAVVNLGRTIRS